MTETETRARPVDLAYWRERERWLLAAVARTTDPESADELRGALADVRGTIAALAGE
jgi:hypothetical protein